MWGFSAGGHLAATAGTKFDAGKADASDVIEQKGSRPDFLILSYPVITFHEPDLHRGSLKYLLGDTPDPQLVEQSVGGDAGDEGYAADVFVCDDG